MGKVPHAGPFSESGSSLRCLIWGDTRYTSGALNCLDKLLDILIPKSSKRLQRQKKDVVICDVAGLDWGRRMPLPG